MCSLAQSYQRFKSENSDKQTSASRVPPNRTFSSWAPHLDLAMVTFCCQIPQSAGRMEKIFYFKDAPGIHSISPSSYFSPYSTITGFQSCCSVCGICVCNGEVAGLSDQDGKDPADSSRGSFLILSLFLSAASSARADPCPYFFFLQINHFSLPLHFPPTPPSLPWSLKKTDGS